MGVTEELIHLKKVMATIFTEINAKSIAEGVVYKYTSMPSKDDKGFNDNKGWLVKLIMKKGENEERVLQEFGFKRPSNIDHKSMEYHSLLHVLSEITHTAMFTYNSIASQIIKPVTAKKVEDGQETDKHTD